MIFAHNTHRSLLLLSAPSEKLLCALGSGVERLHGAGSCEMLSSGCCRALHSPSQGSGYLYRIKPIKGLARPAGVGVPPPPPGPPPLAEELYW